MVRLQLNNDDYVNLLLKYSECDRVITIEYEL